MALPVAILAVLVLGILVSPSFLTLGNLLNVATSMSILGIVVVAMTFVLVSGGLADLSVPATVAMGAILALALQPALGTAAAFVLAVAAAGMAGVLNGVLIGYARINAIIATLATGTVILGIAQWAVGGVIVYGSDPASADLIKGRVAGIPVLVIIFLVVAVAGHLLLDRTVWGRHTRATGDSPPAATAAAVPVRRIKAGAFALTGLAGGLSGGLLGLTLQSARPMVGQGYEFDAITAVVVGGVSILGGQGSVPRAVGGLVFVQLLANVMTLAGIRTPVQGLVLGLLIIAAVALDILVRRRGGA
jgi:ribose transport system permease protein